MSSKGHLPAPPLLVASGSCPASLVFVPSVGKGTGLALWGRVGTTCPFLAGAGSLGCSTWLDLVNTRRGSASGRAQLLAAWV